MSRTTILILAGLGILLLIGAGFALIKTYTAQPQKSQVVMASANEREAAIKDYLSYSEFIKPRFKGRVFTSILKLDERVTPQEYVAYIWAHSQEYYQKNKELTLGTSASGPIVIHMNANGSEVTRIEMPGNGSQYWADMKKLFPPSVLTHQIFSSSSEYYAQKMSELSADAKTQAQNYYDRTVMTETTNPNIIIDRLIRGATVSSPLTITGKARTWYFEGSFPVKVLDANGVVIAEAPAQAQGEWATSEFVPFEVTLSFIHNTPTGTILFQKDNPSGLPEHDEEFRIPVQFTTSADVINVTLYYPNTIKAQDLGDTCSSATVIPINRTIIKSESTLRDTINLLLEGNLTQAERDMGFTTEFPKEGFELKDVAITSGEAVLEFTEVPGFTSGGSCRVELLRSQIEKTAKQFSQVKSVKIIPESLFQP